MPGRSPLVSLLARLWLRKVRVDTVPYLTPCHTAALEAASRDSALNTGQSELAVRELTIGAAGLYADLAGVYTGFRDRSVEGRLPIPNNAIYSWGARL